VIPKERSEELRCTSLEIYSSAVGMEHAGPVKRVKHAQRPLP